jgi:hypothetical protein
MKHDAISRNPILGFLIILVGLFGFVGCSPNLQSETPIQRRTQSPKGSIPEKTSTAPPTSDTSPQITIDLVDPFLGYTFPQNAPIEIRLPSKPVWITGVPYQDNVIWAVVLEDGSTKSFHASDQDVIQTNIQLQQLSPGMPPLLISLSNQFSLVTVPFEDQSPFTHPVYLPQSNQRAYITTKGELKFIDSENRLVTTLEVNALPDARILVDENERLLVLSDPTDKYNHGVLGDQFEAESLTLIETQPEIRVVTILTLSENEVIEGISPIWVDLNGDENREIVVTISDINLGAGIVILSESGERLSEGPKMGRPFRWRHQIGFLNLGVEGENELVVVRTPHIGGVVEYYQYNDGELNIIAEYPGITSHTLGSRNLDLAALGDFDGNGVNELLLPNPELNQLVAVRRTPSGAEEAWRADIGGVMSTNISGVSLPNDNIAFAVGRENGFLIIWMP